MEHQQSSNSILQSSDFSSKLSQKLLSFSENKKFSDICIITSDDIRFHAHKCVLSAFSDYFMVMFESSLKEATANEVKVHEINEKVFKPILTFLYTGQIELQNNTIEDILEAANFLQILPLIGVCYNIMAENMDATNCLSIADFADKHNFIELFNKASKFASANFEKVSSCKDFLELEEDKLSMIVSSKDLCVTTEEAVFFSLIKWIEHDKTNREKSAYNLISKVRYWMLSVDFIKQHRSKLPHQVECLEMICTWLEWHSSTDSRRPMKPMQYTQPKKPFGIMFVGGGGIQTYNPKLETWARKEISNIPNRFDDVVAFNDKLIFSFEDSSLTCFDLQTMEIKNLPKMTSPRRKCALAVVNNELYAIGGYNDQYNWKRIVEKYNYTTDKWQAVVPMNNILVSPKAAVSNNKLYVMGESTIMECFEPTPFLKEWTSKTCPGKPRSSYGIAQTWGYLYRIGGAPCSDDKACFEDVASYCTCNNTWKSRTSMKIPLANLHCIGWSNLIITCGGRDETGSYLNFVQKYNTYSLTWSSLAPLVEYNPLSYDYGLVSFE